MTTRREAGLQDVVLGRHRVLEHDCEQLVAAAFGDPHVFASCWHAIDEELREHMAAEEDLVLPAYQLVDPADADALRTEHAHIRHLLDDIAAHANHGIHSERLRRLVAALHAHAAREDAGLYPWAERNLPEPAAEHLRLRIGGKI